MAAWSRSSCHIVMHVNAVTFWWSKFPAAQSTGKLPAIPTEGRLRNSFDTFGQVSLQTRTNNIHALNKGEEITEGGTCTETSLHQGCLSLSESPSFFLFFPICAAPLALDAFSSVLAFSKAVT